MSDHSDEPIRLSKLLSQRGLASRREADDWIAKGWVMVDGEVVSELGSKVSPNARIQLLRAAHSEQKQKYTILINKPVGLVSAQAEKDYEPAISLVRKANRWGDKPSSYPEEPQRKGLAVAGRLDIDSQGLLVLTHDGRIAKKLIEKDSLVEKEYIVRVSGELSRKDLKLLCYGLELDGRPLRRAQVEWINEDQLRFILREGRKRQIRRMCESVGLNVTGLKRVRIGQVRLGELPEGSWRYLLPEERF